MIYGDDWASKSRDLARYFTKHIGCRMAHDGFHVPDGITSFLDGAEAAEELTLQLGIDAAIRGHFEPLQPEVGMGLFIWPAVGNLQPQGSRLLSYESGVTIGYLAVRYAWVLGGDSTSFHSQRRLPLKCFREQR